MIADQKPDNSESKAETLLGHLIARIPYSDGSTRRRLLAGVIVGVTVWKVANPTQSLIAPLNTEQLSKVFQFTFPSIAIGITVYLLGTLVQIVGDVSLTRAAAAGLQALKVPPSHGQPSTRVKGFTLGVAIAALVAELFRQYASVALILDSVPFMPIARVILLGMLVCDWAVKVVIALQSTRLTSTLIPSTVIQRMAQLRDFLWFCCWLPFRVAKATLVGFGGQSSYVLNLEQTLSDSGKLLLEPDTGLPQRVRMGLENPVGAFGELGIHYVIEQYRIAENRKWANRLIGRARDVSAIVSAVVVAFAIVVVAYVVERLSAANTSSDRSQEEMYVREQLRDVARNLESMIVGPGGDLDQKISNSDLYRAVDRLYVEAMSAPLHPLEGLLTRIQILLPASLRSRSASVDEALTATRRLIAAERTSATERTQQYISQILALIPLQIVLFLYWIFFVTLRGAVESMIEALAIERADFAAGAAASEAPASFAPAAVLPFAASATDKPAS